MPETRRSPRLYVCIPVNLTVVGQDLAVQGRTAAVSRHGALLLSPVRYAVGTSLQIQNQSKQAASRVVWVGQDDHSDIHQLGIEFLDDAPTFWGAVYEELLTRDVRKLDPRA